MWSWALQTLSREEATDGVMFLEELPPGVDVFEFWRANHNSDLVTGRHKEVR
jgi:hypothetical protein